MKTLVAYYSMDGSTQQIAEAIAAALSADLLRLRPVRDLPARGFFKYFLGGAQASMGLKSRLKPFDVDLAAYDRIFVGSPIWAGTFVPAFNTFMSDGRLQGKEIAYFYCHMGGADKAEERGKTAVTRKNRLIGSLSLPDVVKHPEESCTKAADWAKGLG